MAKAHQDEELNMKVGARGLHLASEGLFPDQRWREGGQGSESSWVEYRLSRKCPVYKGIDRCCSWHLSVAAVEEPRCHLLAAARVETSDHVSS